MLNRHDQGRKRSGGKRVAKKKRWLISISSKVDGKKRVLLYPFRYQFFEGILNCYHQGKEQPRKRGDWFHKFKSWRWKRCSVIFIPLSILHGDATPPSPGKDALSREKNEPRKGNRFSMSSKLMIKKVFCYIYYVANSSLVCYSAITRDKEGPRKDHRFFFTSSKIKE